jgi:hypothetical protein
MHKHTTVVARYCPCRANLVGRSPVPAQEIVLDHVFRIADRAQYRHAIENR